MLQRLRIGVDVDGVVVDLVQAMLPLLSKERGAPVSKADICHYDIGAALGMAAEDMRQIWEQVLGNELYALALPIDGAIEGLEAIAQHEVYLVSSRPEQAREQTERWLMKYRVRYSRLLLGTSLAQLAKWQRFDVCIEDNLDNALLLADSGTLVLLFDHPWNQAAWLPEHCVRVSSWQEIVKCSEAR